MNCADALSPENTRQVSSLHMLPHTAASSAFDRLTRLAGRILEAPFALISLLDGDKTRQIGLPEDWLTHHERRLSPALFHSVVTSGSPLVIEDARRHPMVQAPGIGAFAAVPLIAADGTILGSFCVVDTKPRRWTETDIDILIELSASVTTEIELHSELVERRAAEEALRRSEERMRTVRRIEYELSETLNIDDVLMLAMDAVLRASDADHGFIGLLDQDRVTVAEGTGRYRKGQIFDIRGGIVGRALHDQQPELILDVTADPDYIAEVPETRAEIVIPLVYREKLIGVLNLETAAPKRFSPEVFAFLELIATRIAVAIDNARLYSRVRELEQLKTDMIRIAAHDLRNPLGGISGFTQMLLNAALPPKETSYVQEIDSGVQRMRRIVGDILSLERIQAQEGGFYETVALDTLLREVFARNETLAREKQLDYRLCLPETPAAIKGDSAQLREAVDNLIGNAIKYTPQNGAVTVRLSSEAGGIIFEVEDTGFGIPADRQARLFQPFYRVKTAETRRIEGTGLGLHLVKNIVERHHGRVRFHSEYGKGSVFGFELPPV